MDRPVVYFGQVPRSLDILTSGQDTMVALAKLSEAILGTATVVAGFACSVTGSPSLNLVVGPGQIYELENLEATPVSGLAADTHQILKQGISLDPATFTLVPPSTVGFAVNILIEASYADVDTGAVVLTFQNPTVPGQTYQGPGGNGQSSNTVRKGAVTIQPKPGTPSTSGSQTTPAPDAGFVGIAVITLAYGATSLSSGNISAYSTAPFIPVTLPGVPAGVQSGVWVYGEDTGTADNYVVALNPSNTPLTKGQEMFVRFLNSNTTTSPVINFNGVGNKSLLLSNGSAPSVGDVTQGWKKVFYDNTAVRFSGLCPSQFLAPSSSAATNPVAVQGIQRFTASGTFTVPANVSKVRITAIGGGAGGGGNNGTTQGASGGGSGTAAIGRLTVTPGAVIAVTVGAAGAGGAGGGGAGSAGGTSSFGSSISCPGGLGGQANGNVNSAASGAAGGEVNFAGMTPQVGGTTLFGGPGAHAPLGYGSGGNAGSGVQVGLGYGSGGSGSGPSTSGGGAVGAAGIVIVEW